MTRTIDPSTLAELTADALRPIYLVRIQLDTETIRFWTGYGQITFNAEVYTGAGTLLNIANITETQEVEANGIDVRITSLPLEFISIALQENYQDRPIQIYFATLNDAGAIVGQPVLLFRGRLDVLALSEDVDSATLEVRAESNLVILTRPNIRRYTDEDQQLDFPGDTFFSQVPQLQDQEIVWGS